LITTYRQRGMGLTELMVAAAISLILLVGVAQIFLDTRQVNNTLQALARLQENGRFAMSFLARDLRGAGYYGCHGNEENLTNVLNQAPADNSDVFFLSRMGQGLSGFEATSTTAWVPNPMSAGASPGTTTEPVFTPVLTTGNGSDIVAIRSAVAGPFTLTADMVSSTASLQIAANSGLASDDIVLVSDCRGGAVFQLTGTATTINTGTLQHAAGGTAPGNAVDDFGRRYLMTNSEVHGMGTTLYYVATNANGEPGLFRRRNAGNTDDTQELASGVENLQLVYGVDDNDDGAADRYVDAQTIAVGNDWGRVVSVRIAMLVRSLTPTKAAAEAMQHCLLGDPSNACSGGVQMNTDDRFAHHVFTTTAMLRNRVDMR